MNLKKTIQLCAAALVGTAVASPALASVYNEPTAGDFSDDRLAPTALPLAFGDTTLFGIASGIRLDDTFDRDYFTITIPAGQRLASASLDSYVSADQAAFIGLVAGPNFPLTPEDTGPDDLLGWSLFGSSQVGLDLLAVMGNNGQGFTGGLGPGTYSFWVQQIGPATEYSLTFNVVPTPGATSLVVAAGVLAAGRRRRVG
jgi:hypothetical protein